MASPLKDNTFLLLLQLKKKDINNQRLVLLKQFLKQKGNAAITIISDAVFPLGQEYCALVILKTDATTALESYVKDYKNHFKIQIRPVSDIAVNTTVNAFNYCICIGHDPLQTAFSQLAKVSADAIKEHAKVDFEAHDEFSSLYLLQATCAKAAMSFGKQNTTNKNLCLMDAMPMQTFLEMKLDTSNTTAPNDSLCKAATSPKMKTAMSVLNKDAKDAYYSDSYFNLKNTVKPQESFTSSNKLTYVFQKSTGVFRFKNTNYERHYAVNSSFPKPSVAIPQITDGSVSINLSKSNEFTVETPLAKWLNDLLFTNTYDLDWPEDHYVGEEASAYAYILSQISGGKVPKDNTVHPSTIHNISMPSGDQPFSEKIFLKVKTHLGTVCSSFGYLNDWYADDGHFDVLIREIALVSSLNLEAASSEMSIDTGRSVETTLGLIFSIINSLIGAIPDIGPPIAAAINSGWNVAKYKGKLGDPNEPIKSTVSEMANKLSDSLVGLIDSSAMMYKNIASNWGKLNTFAEDAIARHYLPEHAFGTEFFATKKTALPSEFIVAGANAWSIIFYQALFAAKHTVDCGMDYTYNGPICKLDALAGTFMYTLPARWYDVSQNIMTGHIVLACTTDAPKSVLQKLFGPDGLGVDPIAFFIGFNGWPQVEPHLFIDFALIDV
ncbi:hypothetical protein [Lacinutrix sp. Hel_I_90]|uniref:hypothetical protein n=1 Tax=Lacinutrix sp. Hel_I_90 TaxID=1249999 RepID=UPI0005C98AC4|nr:hypothetical protein [Lacinutrix sp. Hel_I_90]